jgi:NOL1/NOP2/fmu family ribosome biogenesis protein
LDPLLHGGAYYVQEASSMFIHHAMSKVLGDGNGLIGLDLCAAPGGKSTLLSSLPHFRLIVANEVIQTRVTILQENIIKWGNGRVLVTNNDPEDFAPLGTFFDVVLVDAPCSGSGLFRKDPEAIKEWSPEQVSFCSLRQRRILEHAMKAIKPGGFLVYSTCSYSEEENERNLDHIMDSGQFESICIELETPWGVVESHSMRHQAFGYRFHPHLTKGEGFFCAVFRKTSEWETFSIKEGAMAKSNANRSLLHGWLDTSATYHFTEKDGEWFALHEENIREWLVLKLHLKLRKSGLRLGKVIRDELIMDHELALSLDLAGKTPSLEMDRKKALAYLRKDAVEMDITDTGWHWVSYRNVGLGWAKMVQGKVKNHYPLHWRILMRDA